MTVNDLVNMLSQMNPEGDSLVCTGFDGDKPLFITDAAAAGLTDDRGAPSYDLIELLAEPLD